MRHEDSFIEILPGLEQDSMIGKLATVLLYQELILFSATQRDVTKGTFIRKIIRN